MDKEILQLVLTGGLAGVGALLVVWLIRYHMPSLVSQQDAERLSNVAQRDAERVTNTIQREAERKTNQENYNKLAATFEAALAKQSDHCREENKELRDLCLSMIQKAYDNAGK